MSQEVEDFAILVEETTRSTNEGVKHFVEPAQGALRRVLSKRHQLVFGRRGSGKSSLLRKASHDLAKSRQPHAWVDLEPFKGHSYPDLLISILIESLNSFQSWIDDQATAATNKTSFWKRFIQGKPTSPPLDRAKCKKLSESFTKIISELESELHSEDNAEITQTSSSSVGTSSTSSLGAGLSQGPIGANASQNASSDHSISNENVELRKRSKIDFLRRNIMKYQKLFDGLQEVSPEGSSYLFLDDLYHIRRDDQPQVIDYFHSIAKGHSLWLKIGTIRHRSNWYLHGDPPIGVKLGDDADEINLDLTLEKYEVTKAFLVQILSNLANATNISHKDILTTGAVDRLVLASGGVARDFLGILRRAIGVAQERHVSGGQSRIGAEDVNMAAGDYDTTKRDEFKRDIFSEEENSLDNIFGEVKVFCLDEANSNCFLLDQSDSGEKIDVLAELVDLKLLHKVRSRISVNTKSQQGKIFEAYMLDLSQYSGARKRRGLELIEFWKKDSENKLRKSSLIFHF